MKRTFRIELLIENDYETAEDAKAAALTPGQPFISKEIKQIHDTRTLRQNNAIHLFCELLANEFNERGLEITTVLAESVECPWRGESVKELIWRPVQRAVTGKESTTELNKVKDINEIYDPINKWLGEKWHIFVPFPCIEYQNTLKG